MNALIAIDGSTGSLAALRLAARLLSAERDAVALYYSPLSSGRRVYDNAEPAVALAGESLAAEVFARALKELPAPLRQRATTITGTEDARHGILRAADQWEAEMIAVGARGLGLIERLLLGSVSRYIAHQAKVPVLVAREPQQGSRDVFRVLVACDGSAMDAQIAAMLNKLSWPENGDGHVITVVQPLLAAELPPWLHEEQRTAEVEAMAQAWTREHAAEVEAKRAQIATFAAGLPPVFARRGPDILEGHPAEKILEAIDRQKIDLTIVGAQSAGLLSRMLLGSTSDAILNQSPTSVLLVRGPA